MYNVLVLYFSRTSKREWHCTA